MLISTTKSNIRYMTPKGETRIALVFAAIIFALIAMTFVGCKTPKTVTEVITEYVHDTVTVHKADTVKEVKVTHHTDTVREVQTHTYTLSNQGDTIKEVHHHYTVEKTIVVDSTNRYKSVVDSLSKVVNELKNHEKVVVKTKYILRWWEWVLFIGIVLFIAVMALKTTSKSS